MENSVESAGVHVTIDAYVDDPSVFNEETLTNLFIELAATLDMQILDDPIFKEVPLDPDVLRNSQETGEFHDEGGITGFCIISKSHMSCHAWPLRSFFSMDLFSCGEYDHRIAIDLIFRRLGVKSASINVLHRRRKGVAKVESHAV